MNDQEVTWVLAKRLSELTGYSVEAVRIKAKRNEWPSGIFWRLAPDGNRVFNYQAVQAWMSGEAPSEKAKAASKHDYNTDRAQGLGRANRGSWGGTPPDGKACLYS